MKPFDYSSPQAKRILQFLNNLEKEDMQKAKENQEKYKHEYFLADGIYPKINDNFMVGFTTDQVGSIKEKDYGDIELRIINSPDLIEIYEKHGEETALEILNNLTFIFLKNKTKQIEKGGFTGSDSLWHRGINNFYKSGFVSIEEKSIETMTGGVSPSEDSLDNPFDLEQTSPNEWDFIINPDNQTIRFRCTRLDFYSKWISWKSLGYNPKGNEPNKKMWVLVNYAFMREGQKIGSHQTEKEMFSNIFGNTETLKKYQRSLNKSFKTYLNLDDDIFYKKEMKLVDGNKEVIWKPKMTILIPQLHKKSQDYLDEKRLKDSLGNIEE